MSEGPPEYDLHLLAADELDKQTLRFRSLIQRLAMTLAEKNPAIRGMVHREHVLQAADMLAAARIHFQRESAPESSPKSDVCVFVSYSSEDKAWLEDLVRALDEASISHFVSHRDIRPAEYWTETIFNAIAHCHVFCAF